MTQAVLVPDRAPTDPRHRTDAGPGLLLALSVALLAHGLHATVPAAHPSLVAVAVGGAAGLGGLVPRVAAPGVAVAGRTVLRWAVVLLGLQLSLAEVAGLGPGVLVLAAVVVTGGVVGTLAMGRALGVPPAMRLLLACGFSICGAAAVAGVRDLADADDEEVSAAVALVVVLGTTTMLLLPLGLALTPLDVQARGVVVGASVHEVAQVVVAGGLVGGAGLGAAVVAKLARVVLLAPTLLALRLTTARRGAADAARPPLLPWFVVGFLVLAAGRSLLDVPPPALAVAGGVQGVAMAAAMFALGCGLRRETLRRVGARPVLLAVLATLLVLALALTGALLLR